MVEVIGRYSRYPEPWSKLSDLRKRFGECSSMPGEVYLPERRTNPNSKLSRRLDEETVAALVRSYVAGAHCTELARRYSLSKQSVLKLLHQAGVTMRHQGLSPDELTRAIMLYRSGLSLAKVAQKVGSNTSTLFRTFQREGVERRPGTRR